VVGQATWLAHWRQKVGGQLPELPNRLRRQCVCHTVREIIGTHDFHFIQWSPPISCRLPWLVMVSYHPRCPSPRNNRNHPSCPTTRFYARQHAIAPLASICYRPSVRPSVRQRAYHVTLWWVDGERDGGMAAGATATVSRGAPRVARRIAVLYSACPMRIICI